MAKKTLQLLILLAVCAFTIPQNAAASDDPSGTFLITITDASSGVFSSRSVITLHGDHSVAVIDSGQEGGPVPFSSQLGVWTQGAGGVVEARTIDFSFPFATQGSARVDYKFDGGISGNRVQGSIVLTFFPPNGDPLGGGGTPGGTFNFTGTRVTVP